MIYVFHILHFQMSKTTQDLHICICCYVGWSVGKSVHWSIGLFPLLWKSFFAGIAGCRYEWIYQDVLRHISFHIRARDLWRMAFVNLILQSVTINQSVLDQFSAFNIYIKIKKAFLKSLKTAPFIKLTLTVSSCIKLAAVNTWTG